MEVLHAKFMTANYRMPARALSERSRLDGLLENMGDWLSEALEREGFSDSDLICVRSVHSRVHIGLSAHDEDIAAKWAMSIAASLRLAVDSGSSDVLRYRSRSHALRDLVERVLDQDFSRSWAWRQLGLTRFTSECSDAKEMLVEALQAEPSLVVRLLVYFASKGSLPVLFRKLPLQEWESLATTAWNFAGGVSLPKPAAERISSEELEARAALILRQSVIVRALRQIQVRWTREQCWWIAILAVLECDLPAVSASAINALVAVVAQRVDQPHGSSATKSQPRSSEPFIDEEVLTTYESRFGGLLLILQLCCQLDMFPRLLEAFPDRTLRWAMQQLALRLVPAHENDPAVLAFSGSLPDDVSPSRDESLPSDLEEAALAGFMAITLEELERSLADMKLKGDRLLHFVCRRWCRVEADPGWIQIHFSLSDVSTDIRRAALDLDPGFIPALGVAVVFRYE